MNNIGTRILSAVILAPLFVACIMLSSNLFIGLMALISILMLFEWHDMVRSKTGYLLLGLAIIMIPILSLVHIRLMEGGDYAILIYFIMIWAVDSFAMLGGRKIGGMKLAPRISPKKTWSGLFCGASASAAVLLTMPLLLPTFPLPLSGYKLACFGFIFGVIEQCSDLLISYFKRRFNIKDSGIIIPGHGGMLDRFDGIILTAPIILGLLI